MFCTLNYQEIYVLFVVLFTKVIYIVIFCTLHYEEKLCFVLNLVKRLPKNG